MENYKLNLLDFFGLMEACSEEQKTFASEVIETLNTFNQEQLLAFRVSVGPTDALNVKQLFFEDFIELSRHLQQGLEEHIQSYLESIMEINEDRLYHLQKKITLLQSIIQQSGTVSFNADVKEEILSWQMEEQEMKDITDFLSHTASIIHGIIKSAPDDLDLNRLKERMKIHRGLHDYREDVLTVDQINKRNIAKMIIRNVGHEGMEDKHGLRRLLQACIDFLQTEPGDFWKNASITIYDDDDNMYKIKSGNMKHQFICQMTNGEPSVDDKMSTTNSVKQKSAHNSSTIRRLFSNIPECLRNIFTK